ncbi:centromere protein Q isoform X2 [Heteronotia binoei]|uniref:centromere protein Q isoform X2 n=1 Tax=Heteronotia binoei TaxID=13085 RepID=UPI00292E3893|nr:centromere protein Q isoform X2 [Heteronotia binoei]XP_060087128.1 centromere protein Q isoform X2 [Heteronotia binoei]
MPGKGRGAVKAKRSQSQPGPSSGRRGSGGRRTKKKPEREQGAQPVKKKQRVQSSEETPSERKVVVTPGQRAKWQQLSESSRAHLQSMMRGLILSIIYESPENQQEIEKHLKRLMERLLKCFETLRVPVEKQSNPKNAKKLQAKEEENIAAIEKGLVELQEAIDKSVEEAKVRHEETTCLQNEIQALKRELAAEEEMMSELFSKESSDVLALPKLQKESLEAPVLQELMLKIPNQKGVLGDLNKIQQSKEMKAMLDALEQAYGNLDEYEVRQNMPDEMQSQEENLNADQPRDSSGSF